GLAISPLVSLTHLAPSAPRRRSLPMLPIRLRLALLGVSIVARVVADWGLRLLLVLLLAAGDPGRLLGSWYLATILFVAPFLVLAPLTGCLANSLPRRGVLVGASLVALASFAGCALAGGPWTVGVVLVALASAAYQPALYAVLPAASHDSGVPL